MEQSELRLLWERILNDMRAAGQLGPAAFTEWLDPLKPLELTDTALTLGVSNEFTKTFIMGRHVKYIEDSIENVIGAHRAVILEVLDIPEVAKVAPEPPAPVKSKKRSENPDQGVLIPVPEPVAAPADGSTGATINPGDNSSLNPKHTFDTFVKGKSNEFAHAAAMAVADNPGKTYNPLFLYGGVGLGKTHLMHAIGNQVLASHPTMRVLYVSSEQFTNEIIRSIQEGNAEKFRQKYRNIDVLLVDDIQFLSGKTSTQEEFFHTFNTLYDAQKQVVLSSDRQPREVERLEERLRSRFEWGLIADIKSPDLETRIAILKNKAQIDNLSIPNEVMTFIASRIDSNIRELEGALTRVVAFASLMKKPVTTELAAEALKDIIPQGTGKEINIELIQEVVASYFKLKVEDLHAKKRTRSIAYPRQIAMYLCRELTETSLPQIGNYFGGRDHTTVLHACDKIAKEKDEDIKVATMINELEERIQKL